jgi:hypothetical protein
MKASLRSAVCLLLVMSGTSDAPAQESVVRSDVLRELRAQNTSVSVLVPSWCLRRSTPSASGLPLVGCSVTRFPEVGGLCVTASEPRS